LRVYVEGVAVIEVIADHGRQHVVGGGDGVEIAGEVQVELLHGQHLRVSCACGSALDPEGRAHRGLAQREHGRPSDVVQPLGEPNGRRGLAFAERRWRDGGDNHVFRHRPICHRVDHRRIDLGDVAPVRDEIFLIDSKLGGNLYGG
jgi:hypothetical protein